MGSLGSLGTERPPVDLSFDWFGTTIRCHPDLSDTAIVDFMGQAVDIDDNSPTAFQLVRDCLAQLIHPDDFDTYWRLGREHRQQIVDHMKVCWAVIEEVGKDAGGQQDASAPGPKTKTDGSLADSLQQAFPGRPDLQAGIGVDLINRGQLKAV